MYGVVFDKDPWDLAQLRGEGGSWDGDGEIPHRARARRLQGCSQPPSCARELPPRCINLRVEPFGSHQANCRAPADGIGLATQPLETPMGCRGSRQARVRQVCGVTTPFIVVFLPRG